MAAALAVGGSAYGTELVLDWVSPGSNPAGYYYVSPYTAQVKGTGQVLTLYCIDFNHEVAPPLEWNANLQSFEFANVGNMQYGIGAASLPPIWLKYEAAAWLITQLSSPANTNNLYQQDIYQYAAWQVFLYPSNASTFLGSENAAGGSTFVTQVNNAYNDAFNAVKNGYVPVGWDVVTPDPAGTPGSTQEFLTPDPPAPTPEPASLILLATVFGAVVLVVKKYKTRPEV